MSASWKGSIGNAGVPSPRRTTLLSRKVARLFISLGLVATSVAVLPVVSAGVAAAAPVAAAHGHGGKDGGPPAWGWGGWRHFRHGRFFSLSGTAGSVSSSGFQLSLGHSWLTSTSTTINVTVTTKTIYREPGQASPGIGGVQNGDTVQVRGMPTGPGALTAFLVSVPLAKYTGTAGGVSSGGFQLTVTSWLGEKGPGSPWGGPWAPPPGLTSTSSTLTSTSTTVTVTVTSNTQYWEPGQSSPGIGGVQNGDTVDVTGVQQGAAAVSALLVRVPLVKLAGTISGLSGSTFTLTPGWGSPVTVTASSSTKIFEPGVSSPTIQNGEFATVTGGQAGGGAINALLIVIRPASSDGHHWGGGPGGGHHHGRR